MKVNMIHRNSLGSFKES